MQWASRTHCISKGELEGTQRKLLLRQESNCDILDSRARKINGKNLVGFTLAAFVGGYNAHVSNIVLAISIATGRDPTQSAESFHCMNLIEAHGNDLHVSVTMPCIERCGASSSEISTN